MILTNATVQNSYAGFLLNGEFVGIGYNVTIANRVANLYTNNPSGGNLYIDLQTITLLNYDGVDVTPATFNEKAELLRFFVFGINDFKQISENANYTIETTSGVVSGKRSVTFACEEGFSGTISGTTANEYDQFTFSASGNNLLNDINYTVVSGSLKIITTE